MIVREKRFSLHHEIPGLILDMTLFSEIILDEPVKAEVGSDHQILRKSRDNEPSLVTESYIGRLKFVPTSLI